MNYKIVQIKGKGDLQGVQADFPEGSVVVSACYKPSEVIDGHQYYEYGFVVLVPDK